MVEKAEKKEAGAAKKGKTLSDKKRFSYLRVRAAELKNEAQAVKKEMADLRTKMGKSKKSKGEAKAGAAGGDED